MLTVHLKSGEYLTIGDNITVQVHQRGGSTYVSVDAPRDMKILRSDLHEKDPDGLLTKAHKSPSRRKRDAERYQALQERKKTEEQSETP